jgi:hypothetical protein
MIIEKVNENKFICKYRYSDPVNLLKISEVGEKTFKCGYEAVKYYLQHELHLPGDLDGWMVIDDNRNTGDIKKRSKLKRLEEGDIIASWEWPQASWNEIARFYAGNSDFLLEIFFRKGFFPIITIAIASSLSFIFIQKTQKPAQQVSSSLTLIDKLAMFGIVALLILIAIWLLRWLHDYFYLRPKKDEEPSIVIGRNGIKLGNRIFFFKPPMVLSKIELLEPQNANNPYSVNIDISCGTMVGRIVIPVPQGKIAEAQKVITALSVKSAPNSVK